MRESGPAMTGGTRWLVTCSCGWERECSSKWAAKSVSKLNQKLLGRGAATR